MSNIITKSFCDTDIFKRGRTAERLVATIIQEDGGLVIPSYDYSGSDNNKAPRLQGLDNSYVLPDLDISYYSVFNYERTWVEVKAKRTIMYFRNLKREEHGISFLHWKDYLEVQRITKTPVVLFIYEEPTQLILYEYINELEKTDSRRGEMKKGNGKNEGEMINFPRAAFKLLVKHNKN